MKVIANYSRNIFFQVRDLQKKMQHVENELDITLEKLTQTATKLDEKLKAYALAEGEIQALKRKISLLEDELERFSSFFKVLQKYIFFPRSESKGTITTKELSEASALKDSIDKALKTLETKNMIDEQSKFHFFSLKKTKTTITIVTYALQGSTSLRTN